ncbi:MAG TPA: prepilin-type N-terminal cleavage/methylation domain-containing protein [Acidimicrobiales bacterium]|nr:prepilin-type N-terminal cleavage/methylation domain-containing protein [Acidimicrobiales bacterium]
MREQIQKKREEGFTLIELLIVIIILAILAAIVVFAVGSTSSNAKVSACNADAKSVETAAEAYKAQNGSFATAIGDLTSSVVTTINGNPVTNGPWLRAAPRANTKDDGYSVVYASGNVSVALAATTQNYDGTPNPCDSAGS